jgi:hypothetical protein
MILDSFDHAEEDFAKRQLAEALVEADTITQAVQKGKSSGAWEQLSGAEKNTVAQAEQKLAAARAGKSYKEVRDAIEVLNKATTRLAELMMDSAVSSALHGKTMEGAGEELGEGPEAPHPIAPSEFVK